MSAPKIQFPSTDERMAWFRSQAEAQNLTQDGLFADMQQVYIKAKLAEDHPEQAASIAAFDALAEQMHDLVAGLVVNADTAKDVARRQLAEDIAKAERARDAALAQVDDLKAEATAAKESEDRVWGMVSARDDDLKSAKTRIAELEEQLSDMRTALDSERSAHKSADDIIEQMNAELKAAEAAPAELAAATAEVQRLTTELSAKADIIARADSEIARLTAQVEKLQNKLLGE